MSERENEQADSHRYAIIVGVDFSESSKEALSAAFQLATLRGHSEIHVVHAAPGSASLASLRPIADVGMGAPELSRAERLPFELARRLHEYVATSLSDLWTALPDAQLPSTEWRMHLRCGDAVTAIVQLAADIEADLIVVGSHVKHGLQRFLSGSLAESVLRLAPCPVLVARPIGPQPTIPNIEPPCAECVAVRKSSRGGRFWCRRHAEQRHRAHTYHFSPFRDSYQSGLLLRLLD